MVGWQAPGAIISPGHEYFSVAIFRAIDAPGRYREGSARFRGGIGATGRYGATLPAQLASETRLQPLPPPLQLFFSPPVIF